MERIFLPPPGDEGALSAPMLKLGGGVAVASRAPKAGEAAPNPPKDAAAGAAGAAAGAPKAKGALKFGVAGAAGAAKLNPVFVAGGVGVAVELPNPPNAGVTEGAVVLVVPNIDVAGAAPKLVAAGDEVPNAGAVEPKLKPVDVLGVEVPPDPNPPMFAGGAAWDELLVGAPKLNDGTG